MEAGGAKAKHGPDLEMNHWITPPVQTISLGKGPPQVGSTAGLRLRPAPSAITFTADTFSLCGLDETGFSHIQEQLGCCTSGNTFLSIYSRLLTALLPL